MPPLPRGNDLPEDIRDLVLHQKHDVAHETFGRDVRDLIVAIEVTRKRVAEAEQLRPPFNLPRVAPPQQSGSAGPPGGQQAEPRGYDLGNYMPAPGQQGPAQPHPAHWPPQQESPPFAAPQGYGDADTNFDEMLAEEEEPRRGRRGLVIVATLVWAIGLGGAMAYTYKTFVASQVGRAPLTSDDGPSKAKPVTPVGKEAVHIDKKLLNRLGQDNSQQKAEEAQNRRSDDSNAPRKVRIIPITTGDQAKASGGSTPPVVTVPGVTLDVGPPPSAARVQLAPQAPLAARTAPRAGEGLAPKVPVPKAASKAGAAPSTTGISGYVAVLSSQKSRMDALKVFAEMQLKYKDVLGNAMPDVQEADLSTRGLGTSYRLVVGPPGSRDAAVGICSQLKTAGYNGCWVTAY